MCCPAGVLRWNRFDGRLSAPVKHTSDQLSDIMASETCPDRSILLPGWYLCSHPSPVLAVLLSASSCLPASAISTSMSKTSS